MTLSGLKKAFNRTAVRVSLGLSLLFLAYAGIHRSLNLKTVDNHPNIAVLGAVASTLAALGGGYLLAGAGSADSKPKKPRI